MNSGGSKPTDVAMADPAEMTAVTTTLPKDREFVIKRPGNINWASEKGSFAGSRLIDFGANGVSGLEPADAEKFKEQMLVAGGQLNPAEACNLYFKHRANLLCVYFMVTLAGHVVVLITNHLEDEELEEFQEYQNAMALHMREWHQQRAKSKADDAEATAKEAKERDNLIAMGKKAVEHNLFTKLRELEQEVKELKSAMKKKGK